MKGYLGSVVFTLMFCLGAQAQESLQVDAQVIDLPIPGYPAEARTTGLSGQVRVNVAIDEAGNVTGVRSVTGPDSTCPQVMREDVVAIREAARMAALKARFTPATSDGKPMASTLWVNYDFAASSETKAVSTASEGGSVETGLTRSLGTAGPIRTISGGVLNGKAMELPKPPYPPAARAVRASGAVAVQVLIETDGSVFSAEAVSGHPLLRSASRMAACGSRFTPTLLQGQPVKVSGIITYNFVP